jgi:hypothetical protein
MDASSGAFAAVSAEWSSWRVVYTRDGRRAAWIAGAPEPAMAIERHPSLIVAHFDGGKPRIEATPLAFAYSDLATPVLLAFDHEGRQAVLAGPTEVAMVDTLSGVTTARLDGVAAKAAEFLPDGLVRVLGHTAGIVVLDWNPLSGQRVERTRLTVANPSLARLLGLEGDRALVQDHRELLLLDVASGTHTRIARAERGLATSLALADGGVAAGFGSALWIVSPAGAVRKLIDLGPGQFVIGLAQAAADELSIGLFRPQRTIFVDIATGLIRREENGLVPAHGWADGLGDVAEPGSFSSRLYLTDDDALVELLPDRRRRVIVPAVD